MGCPVRKVRKTGAGAELLRDHELALALARGAVEGGGLPVTVKLRSGIEVGDRSGFELAMRLAEEAGVAAIGFHPRAATIGHKGDPDYALTRELVERIEVPVIVSGGSKSAEAARAAYAESGAAAVMMARGSLGNPWVFEELTGAAASHPTGRGRRRAALGDRSCRAASRHRASGPLPAQVLPLVRGAAGRPGRARRRASAQRRPAARRRLIAENSWPLRRPRYNPATPGLACWR